MSAYQVDTDLIDLIVTATTEHWGEAHSSRIGVFVTDPVGMVVHTDAMRERIEEQAIISGGPCWVYFGRGDQDVLGRELVAANIFSLAARYSDTRTDSLGGMVGYLPEDYTFRHVTRDKFADFIHVLGAIAGYRYQTCEACDEETSFWGRFCQTAERQLILAMPDSGDGWHWSRAWQKEQTDALRKEINSRTTLQLVK